MAFWEIANALFSGIIQFFTNITVPGLGVSVFFVLVALILINVVINVVLIILGVSSAYDDPVSAVAYDTLQGSEDLPGVSLMRERPGKTDTRMMAGYIKTAYRTHKHLYPEYKKRKGK